MPSLLPELESTEPGVNRQELPGANLLQERIPEALQAPRVLAGFTLVVGVVYCLLSYQPLWHTDLWGHLAYGRYIWQAGGIPSTEPLMPLASGMPFVGTAWLSQVMGYAGYRAFGTAALQCLYAFSIAVCLALLIWRCYQRTHSAAWTLVGCLLFAWVNWQQLLIVRPQLAGMVCFVLLLVLLTSARWSRAGWFVVPALFALWANLHGSFPVGLAMLGCFCVGRAIDVVRRSRRIVSVMHDERVRRYFLLTELAAVAVLLNPYGLGIYAEVVSISSNRNLADLVEWEPLTLRMKQGQAAAAAALALMIVYRFSPRRVCAVELLLLAGLGGCALWTSRMILWWAPVATYCFVLHGHAGWNRWFRGQRSRASRPSPRSGKWTVVTAGLVWIFFAYSPIGMAALHGQRGDSAKSLSAQTPLVAVEFLNEHPPQGQVFNRFEWGDYLLWAGPKDMQVFVASHAHLVPHEVWHDYMQVISVAAGWEETLARYGVNTIVIDPLESRPLTTRLRRSGDWRVADEKQRSIVFVRRGK